MTYSSKMTEQQKAQVISKYLDPMDCSSYNPTSYFGMECEESFMQYEESDDGCYMTIGGYVFRCHAKGKDAMTAYVNAIQLYLTLV